MKTYKANEELKIVLQGQGFIETSSCRDKRKGKHAFKLNRKSRKEIYFDNENIQISDW
ncbi:hypothetical protein SAMN06296241_3139 [Salinimicrobium sediminis]|uniref:Uncharacterized protein n=1 Tax=Salinimicrobium sediminis TaxID=1343891 RepID=A0A285X8A1_9FLAO|nr:hypothetical protein SAMN06296241_3139 [Salinimicrobium sediminis]